MSILTQSIHVERYASGKRDVFTESPRLRIGQVIGNGRYSAEFRGTSIGYFNSITDAAKALLEAHKERSNDKLAAKWGMYK